MHGAQRALLRACGLGPASVAAAPDATPLSGLDGTNPGFYWTKGSGTGANKWVLYFKGGGWCYDEASCKQRAGAPRHQLAVFSVHNLWSLHQVARLTASAATLCAHGTGTSIGSSKFFTPTFAFSGIMDSQACSPLHSPSRSSRFAH